MHHSLFGHLVTRFSTHPENLATEALSFILNRTPIAKQAMLRYLTQQTGLALPAILTFQTQVTGTDEAIPDLVGVDGEGRPIVIIEVKFWAGLTDHQPITYLQRLPEQTDSLLLLLAPGQRFPTLWNELVRRCMNAGIPIQDQYKSGAELLHGVVGDGHHLALISWRALLTLMQRALEAEGQHDVVADVVQLQGLCDRMDETAFLPLRSEELAPATALRIQQFCRLIDDMTDMAVAEGWASTAGLRASAGAGWYGRYISIHGHGCLLHTSAHKWAHLRETPFWLW